MIRLKLKKKLFLHWSVIEHIEMIPRTNFYMLDSKLQIYIKMYQQKVHLMSFDYTLGRHRNKCKLKKNYICPN